MEDIKKKVKVYKGLNEYAKKGQIVFAGSSLMEDFPIYEFIQDFSIDRVIYNRGIGGITTTQMLEIMDTCIYDLGPSKIFLNIGTNDIKGEDYSEEGLIERYRMIIKNINKKLPMTKLYLMAYYPVNETLGRDPWAKELFKTRTNKRIISANKAVKELAKELGVRFIDVNKNLYDAEGRLKAAFSVEGIHMYPNGYKAVLDELLQYILEV